MFTTRTAKISLLISFFGHLGLLGVPWPAAKEKVEIFLPLRIEVRVPPDLPRVEEPAQEKELVQRQEAAPTPRQEQGQGDNGSVKVNAFGEKEKLRYHDMVKQRIQQARRYPPWARKNRVEGTVQLGFTVLANGTVKEIKIIVSSGSRMLDKEAAATIERAAPFPHFPNSCNLSRLPMQVAIVFIFNSS